MPVELQQSGHSLAFFQLLGQITRKFKYVEIYIGSENLTNFTRANRIAEYQNPFHTRFDASVV
jgi:hypothetical protein